MFRIELKHDAIAALRKMKSFHAREITDAVERHLRFQPERPTRETIKKLRGKQRTTYRLRVGDYRVFYDVVDDLVSVATILHKSETPQFYDPGGKT